MTCACVVGFKVLVERDDAVRLLQAFFEKLVIIVDLAEALPVKAVGDIKLRFRVAMLGVGVFKKLTRGDKIIGAECL